MRIAHSKNKPLSNESTLLVIRGVPSRRLWKWVSRGSIPYKKLVKFETSGGIIEHLFTETITLKMG